MDSQDTALDKRLYATKEEVLERVKQLAHGEEEIQRAELDHLKTAYYYLLNAERDAAQKAYLEAGGDPMQYIAAPDPTEEEFKAEMQLVKERKQVCHLRTGRIPYLIEHVEQQNAQRIQV